MPNRIIIYVMNILIISRIHEDGTNVMAHVMNRKKDELIYLKYECEFDVVDSEQMNNGRLLMLCSKSKLRLLGSTFGSSPWNHYFWRGIGSTDVRQRKLSASKCLSFCLALIRQHWTLAESPEVAVLDQVPLFVP